MQNKHGVNTEEFSEERFNTVGGDVEFIRTNGETGHKMN